MCNIIVGAQVSTDGVIQAPGGPTEDPAKGFKFGGREMSYFDQVGGEEISRPFKDFDLLLGRKTHQTFAGYWPYQDECAPMAAFPRCSMTQRNSWSRAQAKYWTGSVLLGNIADVKRLK